ncbi:class I SAM-dependent methyltransferase [Puia dinghuensis]|uniref:SAM-dependent methyltransferase n=1 Tax=Puia dinghuensis TaxID=1792502 RepID=A0A8J2XT76_9BACT|nr:class I SAM-dependent methyltransferase [Puia dinghuensis]GGB15138.1 SAM-dependent methyltransferase [Puia dinghuensis]
MKATSHDTHWNASLYDDKHNFVFKYGEDVVQLLAPQIGERILDVGCGTGYLTNLIAKAGARVIGIDKSKSMVDRAQAVYPDLDFRVMSATDFGFDTPFDAVFSNATLHWVLDKEAAVDCIAQALRPGGRLVLEMGGKGNVEEIVVATRKVLTRHGYYSNAATQLWYFPSLSEYTTLLEKKGFRVRFAAHFDRPTELKDTENGIKDFIKMFGNAFFTDIPDTEIETILTEIQDAVRSTNYRNGSWYGNYKRLRIAAVKN